MSNLVEILIASIWDVRIGVALAIVYGLRPTIALAISTLASTAVIIPAFGLFRDLLSPHNPYLPSVSTLVYRKTTKHRHLIEKYGYWGIMFSIAIPLPGTGPWVGALVAALLQLDFVKSSMALAIGIMLAGLISMGITEGITSLIPFLSQGHLQPAGL